jgi:tRNA nucleotidyltransferase (CCA-adding enzyme)
MLTSGPEKDFNPSLSDKAHEEIITTHMNADFDALASMIAAQKLYPGATLVFPGSQEKNLRNFFLHSTSYLFNFTKLKHVDFDRIKRLILVDTRQKSRIGKFADLAAREGVEIHIYDHHNDSEDDLHGHLEVIKDVGATTTILTELIQERNIPLSPDEATILCLGIHEDTGSFTFTSTRPEDYKAAAWLSEQGANPNLISDMLTRELTAEQIWVLSDLTKSAATHIINGVELVLCKVSREEYVGDFAVLVHKFMEMENLAVILALAQMEDKVYLVARSRVEEVNAAEIALAFGGGGHPQAASATIKNKTLFQVEKAVLALLRSRVIPQKRARDVMSSPVIHVHPGTTIKEAARIMTQFNINVLLVLDEGEVLTGYITRQVVEKAVYFGLGTIPIKEYTNIEFATVGPDASLKEIQEKIIEEKLRILPVVEAGKVLGVITRTDLMNILAGGPVIPSFLSESRSASRYLKEKNMAAVLKERLPRRVIELLKNFGRVADLMGFNAYLVGGLVRDILLKRENLDVDIVVEGDGIKFAQEFASVDVATARIEYYDFPAAPPTVEMSSLKMDLYRRDFTINTLAVKLNRRDYGTLIDYFGAMRDIREKALRVLHSLSFVEDPTRVLRAIRFEQRFGFKIGKLTLALMKNAVAINCFKGLSGRRLFLELKLLLMEPEPIQAIGRMDEFDLLQVISPEIRLTAELKTLLEEIRGVLSWFNHLYLEEPYEPWKVYWHGLTSALDPKGLQTLGERLQMGDTEGRRMVAQRVEMNSVLDKLFRSKGESSHYELYKLLFVYDTETLLFMMAKANNRTVKRQISNFFTQLRGAKVSLTGRDLKHMGFQPGPLYRQILDALLEAKLNNQVNTKEDELLFVKENYGDALPA